MTIQVVTFVLDAPPHQFFALNHFRLAIQVNSLGARIPGALTGEEQSRHRKAPFIAVLVFVFRNFYQAGVKNIVDFPIDVPGKSPQPHTDLVGG